MDHDSVREQKVLGERGPGSPDSQDPGWAVRPDATSQWVAVLFPTLSWAESLTLRLRDNKEIMVSRSSCSTIQQYSSNSRLHSMMGYCRCSFFEHQVACGCIAAGTWLVQAVLSVNCRAFLHQDHCVFRDKKVDNFLACPARVRKNKSRFSAQQHYLQRIRLF